MRGPRPGPRPVGVAPLAGREVPGAVSSPRPGARAAEAPGPWGETQAGPGRSRETATASPARDLALAGSD
jgi:hypothetical protein